jgi:two-component system nitrogen regulation response regulator NtrX
VPSSTFEKSDKSKSLGSFVANVEQDYDCSKDQEFLTFLKRYKFRKAFLVKYCCANFSYSTHFNGAVSVLELPVKANDDSNLSIYYLHTLIEVILRNEPNLPCASDNTKKLVSLIKKIAVTNATVLINGSTGTGKEVVSNLIHSFSERREKPFIAINCAAIPDQMLESILFGHEKGAFTGAIASNQGLLRAANSGTILLDEISEMPLNLQSKLLRVIQEKRVMPIGSSCEVDVDVRIIATTNRNMFAEVKSGNFREDLFYRLNVVPIKVPALKERREDILLLARHFLRKSAEMAGRHITEISEEAAAILQVYNWPGNVRQLRNIIEWILIMAPEPSHNIVEVDMLPSELGTIVPVSLKSEKGNEIMGMALRQAREHFEREYLMAQVNRFGGNISQTAGFVGMERSALHRKLKFLGVN